MESQIRPRLLPQQKPDVIKLVYADGVLPVAHAKFQVMALGKGSDRTSDLLYDGAYWVSKTSAIGEIWLADPELIQAMTALQQILKNQNPNLRVWEYIPPSRPQLSSDATRYIDLPEYHW